MNIKLLLTYEQNQTNNDSLHRIERTPRYDLELKECINHWRKNAGILKDIEIIVHTDKPLDMDNVTVIVQPFEKKLKSKYGFVNVHESGLLAHKLYPNNTFIHIDLDMYLQKELPLSLFEKDTIGVYSRIDEAHQREKLFGDRLAETDFIVSTSDIFYKKYFWFYNSVKKICDNKNCDDYDVEEYVADFLIKSLNLDIFENYEIGQGFHLNLDSPYFIHRHIYEDDYKL